jgi:hypothetical protein
MAWDDELATLAEYVRVTFGDDALQAAIDRAVAEAAKASAGFSITRHPGLVR